MIPADMWKDQPTVTTVKDLLSLYVDWQAQLKNALFVRQGKLFHGHPVKAGQCSADTFLEDATLNSIEV